MLSLGLDIGGANTKAILLRDGRVKKHWFRYIPLWKEKEGLGHFLENLAKEVSPDMVGATLTGELCDIFGNKREGVTEIVETTCGAFGDDACLFMSLDGGLLTRGQSLTSPKKLAAANWVASALIVGRKYPNCIFMDTGSTTTDIIPVIGGKPVPSGRTDLQRLRSGELVYTGVLRTPLPCICSEISLGRETVGVAAENFATMADVYRVLDVIKESDYTCETADGRGKDKRSCMRRIARVFCSDLEEIGKGLVLKASEIFREEQVGLVAKALKKVVNLHELPKTTKVIVAGLGGGFLAEKAARVSGFDKIVDLADVYGKEASLMTPAFSVGLLAGEVLKSGRGK